MTHTQPVDWCREATAVRTDFLRGLLARSVDCSSGVPAGAR